MYVNNCQGRNSACMPGMIVAPPRGINANSLNTQASKGTPKRLKGRKPVSNQIAVLPSRSVLMTGGKYLNPPRRLGR
jgi:hypothetical protein